MSELRHACANEVPPLSVLQVWTIWENPCYLDEKTVGFGIRKSIGFGLGKSTSFAIRKSIGLAMRKSIDFVMRKSLNQSFVRSLLCGEHSSMGKCTELWESDLFDLQKMHLPQLEREWFVEFTENAFTSLITTASSLVAA